MEQKNGCNYEIFTSIAKLYGILNAKPYPCIFQHGDQELLHNLGMNMRCFQEKALCIIMYIHSLNKPCQRIMVSLGYGQILYKEGKGLIYWGS
jgi:hypothetical protein